MLEKEHQTCSRNIRKRKDLCKQTGATSINFPDKKRSKRKSRTLAALAESGEGRSFHHTCPFKAEWGKRMTSPSGQGQRQNLSLANQLQDKNRNHQRNSKKQLFLSHPIAPKIWTLSSSTQVPVKLLSLTTSIRLGEGVNTTTPSPNKFLVEPTGSRTGI